MMLASCSKTETVPVVDAGGTTLPAWPRFMEPAPIAKLTPDQDARSALARDRAGLKVCVSQLKRGKNWYGDLATFLAEPGKKK
jgi:hypothetical protein